jgi:hypothetical protein
MDIKVGCAPKAGPDNGLEGCARAGRRHVSWRIRGVPVERLPRSFAGLPNAHWGSHLFLVDDFVTACVSGLQPRNNGRQAARYTIPGIIAHESAVRSGALLEAPDFGDAPGD